MKHLLMLGVMSICQHLCCLLCGSANMQQAQGKPCSLASHSTVQVQNILQILKHLIIPTSQSG